MVNRVSCDSTLEGSSEQRITSDAVIEVNIEVSFAFRVFPVGAIEATGTQVLDQILRLMLPRFLSQLSKDYQAMGFRRHFKATSWDWRDLIVDQNGPYLAQRSLHLFQIHCSPEKRLISVTHLEDGEEDGMILELRREENNRRCIGFRDCVE
uniref:Uncharacterized protein n=1 Tax=Brassica campestris TaxID=3711 RepID=M4CNL9_BRACM